MVLAPKQAQRPMEKNVKPRNKPHGYSHLISDKGAKTYRREKTASSTNDVWKTHYLHTKD
jgi:hypothetical protein